MLDLEAYKKEKNLCSQQVVNVIGTVYKKFDTPLELAVCDPDTGVVLEEQAATALTTEYGPVPKRRERRRNDSRRSTRLTAGQAKLVKKTLTAHGMTMQKLLYNAIDAFMRVAAPEEWKKKTPGRRQPFRAQRNNIMFSITAKGGNVNGWQERLSEENAGAERCENDERRQHDEPMVQSDRTGCADKDSGLWGLHEK